MLLGPDDLSARLQPAGHQTRSDDVAVQSPVPNISDIAGKQRIRLPPVDAVVVEHLAQSELAATELTALSPGRLVAYPIRRVGDHQVRLRSGQHLPVGYQPLDRPALDLVGRPWTCRPCTRGLRLC